MFSGLEALRSVTSSDRLALFVLYVRAREAPLASRSRAQAAPILCLLMMV
jgi:hypothetical protein